MRNKRTLAGRREFKRRLLIENLESRRLLAATDLASISGRVYDDFSGNGYDAGEEVVGAALSLYRDSGNGTFEPTTDSLVASANSDGSGRYEFPRLTSGNYFVSQPAQTVGASVLEAQVSNLIIITASAVEGQIVETIDNFDLTQQSVTDTANDGVPVTSVVAAPEAIGGERDLFVNLTSSNGFVALNVDDPLLPDLLIFDAGLTGDGVRKISWDGIDGDAISINDVGLGGIDLTNNGGALGLQLQIGADQVGGSAVVRLYSDDGIAGSANRYSTATLPIPQTGGAVPLQAEFLPFSQFTATSGGGVNLSSVGAIELEIVGGANYDGSAEIVGTAGQTAFSQDFANFQSADLRLSQAIDNASPDIGQSVTFTVTIQNDGPSTARNVLVRDDLPAGLTLQSFNASQGTFNSVTGVWEVGALGAGNGAVLSLIARVDSAGIKTNFAEVVASDQFDPDSTPDTDGTQPDDNSEDDQSLATFTVESIDLSIVKTAVPTAVTVGQPVTFTSVVTNSGASTASGIQIRDQLPVGISYVSSSSSVGSFNSANSIWSIDSLAPGSSATLTLVGTVNAYGPMINTAEVIAATQADVDSTPNNNVPNEDDQASVTVEAPQIDLSLTKTVDQSSPLIGETIQFTIVLDNAGPSDATSVQVRDVLPAGLQFISSAAQLGSYNSTTGVWNVGSLLSGANASLVIAASPTGTGILTNMAEVINADQPDADSIPDNNDSGEDDQASVLIGTRQIDLSLTQSVDLVSPNVGDQIQLSIEVTNAGPDDATGVSVIDLLPSSLSFVSATPSVGTYDSASGVWNVGPVAKETSETLLIVATVTASNPVDNVAEIIASQPIDIDSTPNNGNQQEDDWVSLTITPAIADLSLTQTSNLASPNVGQNVVYTVTVDNDGPNSASNLVVQDLLPEGLTFVNANASQGVYDSVTGRWSVGSVAPGATPSLQLEATVESPGSKTNTAEIIAVDQHDLDSQPGNGNPGEDDQVSLVITPPVSDLSIQNQIDVNRPRVGDTVQYTVTVANAGPNDATGVSVLDQLPSAISFSQASTAVGAYDSNSGVWSLGQIAAGQSAVLTISGTLIAATSATNQAEVFTADQYDPDSTAGNGIPSEDDQASVQLLPATSDLSLVKNVDRAEINVGEQVTFNVVVSNSGPDPATNVSVIDSLPPGLEFVSATPVVGTYDAASGLWTIGELGVGASTTLSLVATAIDAGSSTNVAQIQSADQLDPDSLPGNQLSSEDDQSAVTVTAAQIDLELTQSVDNAAPNVGELVRFTLRVDNFGPSDATGVTVRDLLPAGLSYLRTDAGQGSYNAASGLWNVGSISSGGNATLELVAIADQILTVQNSAEVISADQPDSDSIPNNQLASEDDQASLTISTPVADLSLTKSANNDRPNVGEQVTYTVNLNNEGPDPATGIQVQDALPGGLLFVSATPSLGNYDDQSGIWSLSALEAASNATLEIRAIVEAPGRRINGAELIAVDQADPDSTPGNQVTTEDDQDLATIDPPVVDLSLTKVASPLRPSVGGELTYTLLLRNDGNDVATGVVVHDQLPDSTLFQSATESVGSFDPITGRWTVPSLAANSSATLLLRTIVLTPGQPENRAEVISVDQYDSDSAPANDDLIDGNGNDEDDQAKVTVVTASSDLELTKSVDDDRPGVGSDVTFTIQVTNAGPDDASDIVVRDQLPHGMTFVSSSLSNGQFDQSTGHWNIPSLAVGKRASLELTATVDTFGERDNVAEIISSSQFDPDSTPDNQLDAEDDQDRVTLIPELVDLALTKVVDDANPNVGDIVRYTLALDNIGPSNATMVEVTDQVPAGLTVTGVESSHGVYDPGSGVWNVGLVEVGVQPTLEVMVRVDTPEAVLNVAEISSVHQPDVDSTPGNAEVAEDDYAEVLMTPQRSDLSLTQSVNIDAPNQNEEILFTIVVQNDGPDTATNVRVRDLLPEGARFVASTATSGDYDPVTGVWQFAAVDSGGAQSLQIVATVQSKVPLVNHAEVIEADQYDPDSNPDNQLLEEDDYAVTLVTPKVVDLSITSEVDIEEPNIGEVFEMTFVVTNDGPDTATGVNLVLQLPDHVTTNSIVPSRGVFDQGLWVLGDLAEGESVQLRVTASAQIRGTKSVTLEVVSHDQADSDSDPGNQLLSEDDHNELLVRVPLYSKRLFLSDDSERDSDSESDSNSNSLGAWRRFG